MVFTMIPLQSFGADLPFKDVPTGEWYYGDVKGAWETGLINGFEDNTFRPNENMTYAQAIKLASCMNQKYTTGSVTLANGSPQWYDSYVAYAKDKSIIAKDYDWNTSATRAGYVEIFSKALPDEALKVKNSIADNAIPDVSINHPQAAAIYKLYRAGILTGMDENGTFDPNLNIRRSDVSAILTRMMNESARKELTLGAETPDPETPEASFLSIVSQPENAAIEEGGNAALSVTAVGGKEPYTYQWSKDGTAISGASSASYTATAAGGYVCQVKDGDGETLEHNTGQYRKTDPEGKRICKRKDEESASFWRWRSCF